MKKIHIQLHILAIAVIWIVTGTPVSADTGLIDVDFHGNTPLFAEANILPGDGVTRTVTVKNESDESQDVYLQLLDAYQTKDLADVLQLTVSDGTNTVLNTVTLSDLFGDVQSSLTTGLAGGDAVTYEVTIAFAPSAGDAYQEGEAGFDFCVGFSGGNIGCDGNGNGDGDDGDSDGNNNNGGSCANCGGNSDEGSGNNGNGNNGQGGTDLIIENEGAKNTDGQTGSTDVTWDTNKPATSRVVCGPEENGPYKLDLDAKNFGYPWSTTETNALITKHSVSFTGLEEGIYLCRVASREDTEDDWTVSSEFSFALSNTEENEGVTSFIGTGETPVALAAHDSKEETSEDQEGALDTDPSQEKRNGQVAGALASIDDALKSGTCDTVWWIWIIVILSFIAITTWTREMLTHLQPIDHIKRLYVFASLGVLTFLIALTIEATTWILPMGVGAIAIIIAALSDKMLTRETDTGHVRFVRVLWSLISTLLVTLFVALIVGWTCAIIPIIVSVVVLVIRYSVFKGNVG